MAPPTYPKYEGGTPSANHLCVLVHGVSLRSCVLLLTSRLSNMLMRKIGSFGAIPTT